MNPQSISTKEDALSARKEYINNLRLEVSNLQKVKNALDVLESTGQTISAPTDNRTQLEKYADLAKIKIILQEKLMEIMDGNNATQTITELSHNPSALRYAVNRIDTLIPYFQVKYRLGTPYLVFLNYIRIKMRALTEEEKRAYGFTFTAKDSEQKTNPKVEKKLKGKPKRKQKQRHQNQHQYLHQLNIPMIFLIRNPNKKKREIKRQMNGLLKKWKLESRNGRLK